MSEPPIPLAVLLQQLDENGTYRLSLNGWVDTIWDEETRRLTICFRPTDKVNSWDASLDSDFSAASYTFQLVDEWT